MMGKKMIAAVSVLLLLISSFSAAAASYQHGDKVKVTVSESWAFHGGREEGETSTSNGGNRGNAYNNRLYWYEGYSIDILHVDGLYTPQYDGRTYKLKKRISRRPSGIAGAKDTMQKLYDRREYTALFLYLAILYGFLEWQVPEKILLLPAVPDALKAFEGDFLSALDERLAAEAGENEAPADSETETADR